MIDTDKYEGHTTNWKWIDINEQDDFYLHSEHGDIINHDTPDGKLAQDAPLLLEEVKRLRLLFRELINDMSADDYIEWCNRIGCRDGVEIEVRTED